MTLRFFDRTRRDYARRVIREQVEVVSLVGNVAIDADELRVHAHVVIAGHDGTALGATSWGPLWIRPWRS